MGILVSMKEIGPETILQRKSNLLFSIIDDEVVMLSIEKGEYYGLDKIGSRIWVLLEQPLHFKDLISKLMKEYEVSDEQCKSDIMLFMKKLLDKKLIICN